MLNIFRYLKEMKRVKYRFLMRPILWLKLPMLNIVAVLSNIYQTTLAYIGGSAVAYKHLLGPNGGCMLPSLLYILMIVSREGMSW